MGKGTRSRGRLIIFKPAVAALAELPYEEIA
jgi:hypothetical protein